MQPKHDVWAVIVERAMVQVPADESWVEGPTSDTGMRMSDPEHIFDPLCAVPPNMVGPDGWVTAKR